MKWIEYDYVCNAKKGIKLHKKVEYNEDNLAVARLEAYKGIYTITEDGVVLKKEPMPIVLGGTNATTAADALKNLGAIAWHNQAIGTGSIKDWIIATNHPTNDVAVGPDVTDMPYTSYWMIELKISANGTWKRVVARQITDISMLDVYELNYVNGIWGEWLHFPKKAEDIGAVSQAGGKMTGDLFMTDFSRFTAGLWNTDGSIASIDAIRPDGYFGRLALIMQGGATFPDPVVQFFNANADYLGGEFLIHTGNIRANAAPPIVCGTTDVVAGSTSLYPEGTLYVVLE